MTASHHWRVFREALARERERTQGRLASAEPDFLPAALEVIETPVSPTGRVTAWVLLVFLTGTLLWLVLGKVDVVASAQGRILPTEDVKLVQAVGTGVVRRIYVHEGDVVRRGQALIDLDPTVSSADEAQARKALLASELDVARNAAIAEALAGHGVRFAAPAGTPIEVAETQRHLIEAQILAVRSAADGMAAAEASARSDARAAGEQVRTYESTVPVLDREVAAMTGLSAKGYAPGLRLLELQRQKRSEEGQRDVAAAQQAKGLSDARKFAQQRMQTLEEARQRALADLAKAQNDVIQRREELTKADRRSRLQRLVAPVDGTVQQLAVHTLGGVVEPVKPLMVVVPEGALTVEAKVLNRDVGFVRSGQKVAVKLEAFPFTRYGTVQGRILSVSRDAVQDRQIGPYYVARIALDRAAIRTETGLAPLTPGMTATSDISIGSRRIIFYLVNPIEQIGKEAGRER